VRSLQRTDVRWAAGLALFALVLRLAFVLGYGQDPGAGFPANDTLAYDLLGRSLASGDGYNSFAGASVQWPPAYPFLLGAVYGIFGAGVTHALVLNAVLGAATVALLYWLALRVLGRRAAIACAALLAIFPGQILIADVMLSETLYTLELVAFVAAALALGRRPRSLALLGVLAGLAALTRGEGFFFPLIVLAMGLRPAERRAALRQAAVVAGVMLLTVVPWTVRNAIVADAFVPVSTNSSTTLWSGHNPSADGGPRFRVDIRQRSKLRGAALEVEEARIQRRDAIDFALRNPRRELELIPLKLRRHLTGDSQVITKWINTDTDRPMGKTATDAAKLWADVFWYALLAATLASAVLFGRRLWRDPALRGMLAFMAITIPLYGFVYYGNFRYRIPLEPLMIVVAAAGAQLAWRRRRPA
jgi:4-amino-4-deoxy-L-arabinose transferase-like glycosyltransferase